ncbi:hypothetical protein M0R45_001672 [Rubus argutus]|uniref:Uncharacterized protein n=1 Tax=Rubus argutus TaxID=59490 RepID=A0AAW1VL99_RUBAR
MVSESKIVLNLNGRACLNVKAMNSGGRSDALVAVSLMVLAVVVERGLREQEEKDEEMNKVMRFVERRRRKKRLFEELDLYLLRAESMDFCFITFKVA